MATVIESPAAHSEATYTGETRTLLHHVSWETYQSLLRDHEHQASPRFTFTQGDLEIMSPLPKHERLKENLSLMISALAEALEIDHEGFGSTTYKREDIRGGFEPDASFYIENLPAVNGKEKLDFTIDPPPDLVIEIDLTHSSIDKLSIFAAFGVPEVWRHDGIELKILILENRTYHEREASKVLSPRITRELVMGLLMMRNTMTLPAWLRSVRATMQNGIDFEKIN